MSVPKPGSAAPARAIVFRAFAGFASQAMVRVADPLLPQIAADIGTTVGAASVVISAYAVSHGLTQLLGSPIGDHFPKFILVGALYRTGCGRRCRGAGRRSVRRGPGIPDRGTGAAALVLVVFGEAAPADLKSVGRNPVPVRVRPSAPFVAAEYRLPLLTRAHKPKHAHGKKHASSENLLQRDVAGQSF